MKHNTQPKEQRHYTRVPFDGRARLSNASTQWEGKLIDISLRGVLLEHPPNWNGKLGDDYLLELLLHNEAVIKMQLSVVHFDKRRIGFHCDHIDLDSMGHLKRLMELNLGDEDRLNRELSSMG
ncbi:MAG: PilZ domain-containing protein [Gammaproteobacteria bacterium]